MAPVMSQMAICVSPTAPDADQLAREHVSRACNGEHHFEDARCLLLDDGAGHVHAVDHGRHGEEDGHDVAFPEGCFGITFDDAAVLFHLVGFKRNAVDEGICIGMIHSTAGQPRIEQSVIDCGFDTSCGDEVAGRWRGIGCGGRRPMRSVNPKEPVDGLGLEPGLQDSPCPRKLRGQLRLPAPSHLYLR